MTMTSVKKPSYLVSCISGVREHRDTTLMDFATAQGPIFQKNVFKLVEQFLLETDAANPLNEVRRVPIRWCPSYIVDVLFGRKGVNNGIHKNCSL